MNNSSKLLTLGALVLVMSSLAWAESENPGLLGVSPASAGPTIPPAVSAVGRRVQESLANRAVDASARAAVSAIQAVPGGAVVHGIVDGAASSYLQGGEVDWTRTISGSVATTVLATVVAPEGAVAGVAVDLAGGWVGDKLVDGVEAYPAGLTSYAIGLARAARVDSGPSRSPEGRPYCKSFLENGRWVSLECGSATSIRGRARPD